MSPFHFWIATNPRSSTPETTKRAMMRPSFQGYLEPPQTSARRRQITPGRKTAVPSRSSTSSCSLSVNFRLRSLVGEVKKKMMKIAVTAPKGRLM